MRDTFARELKQQEDQLSNFRKFAHEHILESRHPNSIPNASLSMESFLESTDTEPGRSGSESGGEFTDRSTEDDPPNHRASNERGRDLRDYGSSAKTIPWDGTSPKSPPPPDTKRRLGWLLLISLLAIVAGIGTVYYALDTLNPSSLRLVTQPANAQIYLDGRLIHDSGTPIELRNIEPGEHWLVVSAPDYHREKRQLNLVRGEQLRLRIKLRSQLAKTRLVVDTRPGGATVFLDGEKIDESPLRVPEIEPGEHSLRIEKDGYMPWAGRITLLKGMENQVPVIRLAPAEVSITFIPEPLASQIFLINSNGEKQALGQGAQNQPKFSNLGTTRVRAEAPGFLPLERVVPQLYDLRHTEFLSLSAKPSAPSQSRRGSPATRRPPPAKPPEEPIAPADFEREDIPPAVAIGTGTASNKGTLKLLAVPPARVYVNGKDLGWTPLLKHSLPAGKHAVLLVREEDPAYRKSFTIDVNPGETTFRRFVNE